MYTDGAVFDCMGTNRIEQRGIAQMPKLLSIRLENILRANDLSIENTLSMLDSELLELKHFGLKSLAELRQVQMIHGQACYSNHNGQCNCTTLCPLVQSAWRLGIDKSNVYDESVKCRFYNPIS